MAQPTFRKILVPVDLSEKGRSALEWSARMCGPEAAVVLLHVVRATLSYRVAVLAPCPVLLVK